MKKLHLFGVMTLLAAAALLAPPAGAVSINMPQGSFSADLSNASSLYTPDGTPRAPIGMSATDQTTLGFADTTAQLRDEQRVLFNVNQFAGQSLPPGTLVGMMYDLVVVDSTTSGSVTTLYFAPGTRNELTATPDLAGAGGVVELWYDPSATGTLTNKYNWGGFDPGGSDNAPALWGDANYSAQDGHTVAPDTYPGVNTGSEVLWLQAVLDPLGTTPNTGDTYVWMEIIDTGATHSGSTSTGYLDILGGSAAGAFAKDLYGLGMDISLIADIGLPGNVSKYNGTTIAAGNWAVSSSDPINGAIIPEPGTLSLLGMSLIGLVGGALKRRRVN